MARRLLRTVPRSPFSTPLSGSAKEMEQRLRSIFSPQKKRPPLWLMTLALLAVLTCGGLVSCQSHPPAPPTLVMEIQYYDNSGHWIELPALISPEGAQPDEGIASIQEALAELKEGYTQFLSAQESGASAGGEETMAGQSPPECLLFYPTETDRYLNLLFFQSDFTTDLNTGHVLSLVYDKETGQQVFLQDALTLAGQTEDGLHQALAEQYAPELIQQSQSLTQYLSSGLPPVDLSLQNPTLEGFRMGTDGQPIFYLTARVDDRDDAVYDAVSGADHLYIWSDGTFTQYDQHGLELPPLVPPEETIPMDPPLWCQSLSEGTGMDSQEFYGLLADALADYYQEETVYFASDQPDNPTEGDRRFDRVTYAGQVENPAGTLWEAYRVEQSVYLTHAESTDWLSMEPLYFIVERGADGTFLHSQGLVPAPAAEDMEISKVILQAVYGLLDIEASLWPEDAAQGPVGLGAWRNIFSLAPEDELSVEQLAGGAPTYNPGDYWERWSIDGFTALRYYNWAEGTLSVYSIETTRTDLCTYRGIRVGDSREQVEAAYPELKPGGYWHLYSAEEDFLYYCDNSMDLGPAVLFFFDQDRVSKIELWNMFD